jgi:hypothetical protein
MRLLRTLSSLTLLVGAHAQEPAPRAAPPPPASARALDLRLDGAIEWIRDPETVLDGRRTQWGLNQPADRVALLEQALARAKAERKPVLWYIPRIVEQKLKGRQMYRAPVLDLYVQQVFFAEPDVASIVQRRFIPLRLACDEALAARFELRPLEVVEPAFLFLAADGSRLHLLERVRTFNAHWFADLLRRVLDAAEPGDPQGLDAATAYAEGRWHLAQALLTRQAERSPAERLLLARVLRMLRRPQDALAELDRIEPGRQRKLAGDVAAERALLLAWQGDASARALFERGFRAGGERAAEAGYWLASYTAAAGRIAEATKWFQLVADRHPDDPFGRRARLNLMLGDDECPLGATFCGFENPGYLDASCYEGLPRDTAWHGPPASANAMRRAAVARLLGMQREHGGFTDSRYAYWPSPDITPNAHLAITALAAAALFTHRAVDPARIDAALARAEEYLFDPGRLRRGTNEDVYAAAYRLLYLSRRAHEEADKAACVARMNRIVAEAAQRQSEPGFWAHEYNNAFCTAVMLWCAREAKLAGATVPDEMVDRGIAALISARYRNGAFAYGGSARSGDGDLKNASARMPLCEGTLFVHGRSRPEDLDAAFATFWQYIDRIEQVRRNDFHSDGELAGFFFFHALFHASESMKVLDEPRRAAIGERIFTLLQKLPEIDGSFLDDHEIGRSYGTAMALLTLANLDLR